MLNDRGVPNPTEYKRLHGLRYKQPTRKNSTLWKYFAISDMLCNEMYIGNMVQGKYGSVSYKTKQNKPRPKDEWYRVEGTHEAIIDRELWDAIDIRFNSLITACSSLGTDIKEPIQASFDTWRLEHCRYRLPSVCLLERIV